MFQQLIIEEMHWLWLQVQETNLRVQWVLDVDDVLAREGLVCEQVLPALRLHVELLDCLPAVHVPGGLDCDDVCVLREHLTEDGALILAIAVFGKV
jgi:hypothetical protein